MIIIRTATIDDLNDITEIYNDAVLNTLSTFDTEPITLEEQKVWFAGHGPKNPILVAKRGNKVAGWVSLSEWSGRCAYTDTAEISIYIHKNNRGKGIGKMLINAVIKEGKKAGLHTIIARIVEGSQVSIYLHESAGFQHIGIMKEAGRKFGKLLDVIMMQYIYED
jgi:phosphinothricin acetyltransferase